MSVYHQRAELLSACFVNNVEAVSETVLQISCETTVAAVLGKVAMELPSMIETRKCSSGQCPNQEIVRPVVYLNIDPAKFNKSTQLLHIEDLDGFMVTSGQQCSEPFLNVSGPGGLQDDFSILDDSISDHPLCTGILSFETEISKLVFLEVLPVSPAAPDDDYDENFETTLDSVPLALCIKPRKQNYYLRAVIAFRPPAIAHGLGHYMAYCRRAGTGRWEAFDDMANKSKCVPQRLVVIPSLLLYTA